MKFRIILILFITLLSNFSYTVTNTCENRFSFHLNENYPAKVIVISGLAYTSEDLKTMVLTIFKNQKENAPYIILLGVPINPLIDWDQEINQITDDLPLRDFYKQHLKEFHVSTTWAQDFFESFYDSNEKINFIRLVQGYKLSEQNHYKGYLKAQEVVSKQLQEILGKKIRVTSPINNNNPLIASKNGHKGGNIESTNEGHCLIGDADLSTQEWDTLSSQVCRDKKYAIKLPTSWLPANHADELIRQLPSSVHTQNYCVAKFGIISLKKALEILKLHENELFWKITINESDSKKKIDLSESLRSICGYLNFKDHADSRIIKTTLDKVTGFDPIIPKEGYTSYTLPIRNQNVDDLFDRCLKITNKEILDLYENDERYKMAIEIVEDKIKLAKTAIVEKYQETNPECKVEFVDLPVLMSVNKARYYSDEQKISMIITRSDLLLPNPINSLQVGKQIFVPDTVNERLKSYIYQAYKSNSLDPIFLDTFEIHNSGGNIHCSTQTVRDCL